MDLSLNMSRINLKGLQETEQFLGTITSRNHLILKWKDRPPGCPPITGRLVRLYIYIPSSYMDFSIL